MSIENIKQLMDGVDIAQLLPDLQTILRYADRIARFALMIGPVVLLFLGLHYLLRAPKEANYTTGYRFRWGMASVESWRFMQQVAGIAWTALGIGMVVAMGITGGRLSGLEIMDLLFVVIKRLVLQVILLLSSCLVIDLLVLVRYDRKGKRRLTWRELYSK